MQRVHHERRVQCLAGTAAEEAPELILDRAASPLRLLLERTERRQLPAPQEHGLHSLRAERADELALEIRLADEEAEGTQVFAAAGPADAGPLECTPELRDLAGIAEPRGRDGVGQVGDELSDR